MCDFLFDLKDEVKQRMSRGETFTVMDIRDALRALKGSSVEIEYHPVKYDVLTCVEKEGHEFGYAAVCSKSGWWQFKPAASTSEGRGSGKSYWWKFWAKDAA